jgi:predicted GIY-YIG superfamily endonuclease
MEQNKYQDAVIYTIKTDTGLYVGSTCDFAQRKFQHKGCCFVENRKEYNLKLYQNIRENGGEYSIEIYKMFPCNNKEELHKQEEEVRKYLNPNLNSNKAYRTKEDIKKKQAEIITCECGCETTRGHISRHRKSKKHLNRMNLPESV